MAPLCAERTRCIIRMRNFGMNASVAGVLGKKKFLGDAIMRVSDFSADCLEHTLPLIDPDTGTSEASLVVTGRIASRHEALYSREDICFEYQRYTTKWGDNNLLPTDPGRCDDGQSWHLNKNL